MMNKGLDSLQLLLYGPVALKCASEVMTTDYTSLPVSCSGLDVIRALAESSQQVFPVIEKKPAKASDGSPQLKKHHIRLAGTVARQDMYFFIKDIFMAYDAIDSLKVIRGFQRA